MRRIQNFNENWTFSKEPLTFKDFRTGKEVNLPHTWNARDGQDGGNDYYRGACYYAKEFELSSLPEGDVYYLEVNGANSSATVSLNGEELCHHDGGYSRFRVELKNIKEHNLMIIKVDNSPSDSVYPQFADFTFYGGLYRDVNIIAVPFSHFDLEYYAGPGIRIQPEISGKDAIVEAEVYIKGAKKNQSLEFVITDHAGSPVSKITGDTNERTVRMKIENARLWQGRLDPHLYHIEVSLIEGECVIDKISSRFGCREFSVDAERGFILNGKEYSLRGVSRHQDRAGLGNALSREHHEEDVSLILEMGANAVRLAHYQHDEYFYELCDEAGLIVWAEIPYISRHLPKGDKNAESQMQELVIQNYNHPSICFWGLSNEITMGGVDSHGLIELHTLLNGLCHALDSKRLTTVAAVTTCPTDAEYLKIPDLIAYNHYFGWYGGDVSMNGEWFDEFHKKYPQRPIGISEYGCEALDWHSPDPKQGDYTEEYQAYYHEEMIKTIRARPYLWATFVWNMFDFAADARCEGGEAGMNHKGLVTFDRKYKKDSFYAYKAWLSDEPFVHIAGKRYEKRHEDETEVTVYSNLSEVELFVNGKSVGKSKDGPFFKFKIKNEGESELVAKAGECSDTAHIVKVESFNEEYRLKEVHAVLNWFDITEQEGRFSLNDKISDIVATEEGRRIFEKLSEKMKTGENADMEMSGDMMKMLGGFSFIRFASLSEMLGIKFTKEELLDINHQLNEIKKGQS